MSNRIKELRNKKGMTLIQLGKELGMRDNTLSQYETGKRNPSENVWKKIADYFDVSVEYIKGFYTEDMIVNLLQQTYIESLKVENFMRFDGSEDDGQGHLKLDDKNVMYTLTNDSCNEYFILTGRSNIDLKNPPERVKNTNYSVLDDKDLNDFSFWKEAFSFLFDEPNQLKINIDLTELQILKVLISKINLYTFEIEKSSPYYLDNLEFKIKRIKGLLKFKK